MDRHIICKVSELPPGERKIVELGGRSIGVFNINGEFYALRNLCPHKGAPLCAGQLKDLVTSQKPYTYALQREGEILRCPWHGWEFDIKNGRSTFNPHRLRVKSYEIFVESIDEDPTIETFPVSVEREAVVLYLRV